MSLGVLMLGTVDADVLETLRRETHSLKGDSRMVGLDDLADLVQSIEDTVKLVQLQPTLFTPLMGEGLSYGLAAIGQLVDEAVSGEPSGVDLLLVHETLQEMAAAELATDAETETAADIEAIAPAKDEAALLPAANLPAQPVTIEDAELREIYRTTSEERLQTLEAQLLYLEKNPQDEATLAVLMREAHSLKGDSRSTGVDSVEAIAHAVEDVLVGIQQQAIALDTVGQRCPLPEPRRRWAVGSRSRGGDCGWGRYRPAGWGPQGASAALSRAAGRSSAVAG